jgi:cob(I)alamin adenosyltransferase
MAQFIKSNHFSSGEDLILAALGKNFTLLKGGKGFVGILGDKLPLESHRDAARQTLREVEKAVASGSFQLVILDEINVAVSLGLLSKEEVLALLDTIPSDLDLICTGRAAPQEFIERADLVTRFEEVKHPFHKGVAARPGVEY